MHGDARGRTIGYPTANLAPIDRTYLPSDGVYVVDVDFKGQTYRGMASVGKNVTFDGKELRFEVNLFDFTGDIYGHTLTIHWLDKIREMVKFDGIDPNLFFGPLLGKNERDFFFSLKFRKIVEKSKKRFSST